MLPVKQLQLKIQYSDLNIRAMLSIKEFQIEGQHLSQQSSPNQPITTGNSKELPIITPICLLISFQGREKSKSHR